MTERPGRESRRLHHRVKLARHLSERTVEQFLFSAVVTFSVIITVGHLLSTTILVTWLAMVILIAAIEVTLSTLLLKRTSDPEKIIGTNHILLTCSMARAIGWGLIGLYIIMEGDISDQVFLAILVSCLVICATTQASAHFGPFILYVSLLVGPSAVGLIVSSDIATRSLGILLVLLLLAGLANGWQQCRLLSRALRAEADVEEMNGVLLQLNQKLTSIKDYSN